jgi:hypothetical protein
MGRLHGLAPVSRTYATLAIAEAFNWDVAAPELGQGRWYLVAFRSVRRPGADEERLALFDELAHEEAAGCPGFVHYFKGPAASDGSCLSFCLWETREQARVAARMPAHVKAVGLIDEMYASYVLEFHHVTATTSGQLAFEPYGHQEVQPVPRPGAKRRTRRDRTVPARGSSLSTEPSPAS